MAAISMANKLQLEPADGTEFPKGSIGKVIDRLLLSWIVMGVVLGSSLVAHKHP